MLDCMEHNQLSPRYGKLTIGRRTIALHRWVYCQTHNIALDSIKGLIVRHKCDNPRCINPEHLELGTHQDNMNDRKARGRTARHEGHGRAILNTEDVRYIREHYIPRHPEFSGRALAAKFGVSANQISKVIKGMDWTL